jgi:hypothetical protein
MTASVAEHTPVPRLPDDSRAAATRMEFLTQATGARPERMLGCYRPGQVGKLAEIMAATVPCGEISLGSAATGRDAAAAGKGMAWSG